MLFLVLRNGLHLLASEWQNEGGQAGYLSRDR